MITAYTAVGRRKGKVLPSEHYHQRRCGPSAAIPDSDEDKPLPSPGGLGSHVVRSVENRRRQSVSSLCQLTKPHTFTVHDFLDSDFKSTGGAFFTPTFTHKQLLCWLAECHHASDFIIFLSSAHSSNVIQHEIRYVEDERKNWLE